MLPNDLSRPDAADDGGGGGRGGGSDSLCFASAWPTIDCLSLFLSFTNPFAFSLKLSANPLNSE